MHDCGIVHRDIKLENILRVGPRPQDIKISDFGISTFFTSNGINGVCGTAEYIGDTVFWFKIHQ